MTKKILFSLSFLLTLFFSNNLKAQSYSDISLTNSLGEVSTEQVYDGVQSYKVTGANNGSKPKVTVKHNMIAGVDWKSIKKATVWMYTTSSWCNGKFFENSDGAVQWADTQFEITAPNTWEMFIFDITNYESTDTWAQFGIQSNNKEVVLFIDEITFYDASNNVVYEIDASDVLVAPSSISVSPNPISAIPRKTQALSLTFSPSSANKSVTYSSANPTAVTVNSSGVVTTVGIGTTQIIATSTMDANAKGTTTVNVVAPSAADNQVYADFEDGFGNYRNVWSSWNNGTSSSGPTPTVTVVNNPLQTGNSSANVLKVEDCYQHAAIVFKSYDYNKINTVKFKMYSPVAIPDMTFTIGLNGANSINTPETSLPANQWTEYSFDVTEIQSENRQFYIKFSAASSQIDGGGTAYTYYIDDLTHVVNNAVVAASPSPSNYTSVPLSDWSIGFALVLIIGVVFFRQKFNL